MKRHLNTDFMCLELSGLLSATGRVLCLGTIKSIGRSIRSSDYAMEKEARTIAPLLRPILLATTESENVWLSVTMRTGTYVSRRSRCLIAREGPSPFLCTLNMTMRSSDDLRQPGLRLAPVRASILTTSMCDTVIMIGDDCQGWHVPLMRVCRSRHGQPQDGKVWQTGSTGTGSRVEGADLVAMARRLEMLAVYTALLPQ